MDRLVYAFFMCLLFINYLWMKSALLRLYDNQTSPKQVVTPDQEAKPKIESTRRRQEKKDEQNDEWDQLGESVFVRRQAGAFYLLPYARLHILVLDKYTNNTNETNRFRLKLLITYERRAYNLTYEPHELSLESVSDRLAYRLNNLVLAEFNLANQLGLTALSSELAMKAVVENTANSNKSSRPIDVAVKYWSVKTAERKGTIICGDCLFYGNSTQSQFEQLSTWIEMNKLFGYQKLVLCNTTIPNTREYNALFAKHAQFVELSQLHYLPNIREEQQSNLYDADFEALNVAERDLFKIFHYNQCFMNNVDKYERVLVQDVDELLIPRHNRLFRRDSDMYTYLSDLHLDTVHDRQGLLGALGLAESSCLKSVESLSPIDAFVEDIETMTNGSKRTLYFKMGHHLNDATLNAIIDGLAKYLNSSEFKEMEASRSKHHVHDIGLLHADSSYGRFAFKIVMKSKRDILYAKNLVKLYKLLLSSLSVGNFSRFVFINGEWTSRQDGKTMHDTSSSLALSIHGEVQALSYPVEVDQSLAHLSHFRKELNVHFAQHNLTIVLHVSDIKVDLNYLFCFYRQNLDGKEHF